MYRYYREQELPCAPDRLWAFLSDPRNLNAITPPDLDFEILDEPPDTIHDGLMIAYRVRVPWLGRRPWLTEIKHIDPGRRFVDEQRIGPYRLWVHRHEILPTAGGSVMIDDIRYAVPGGPLAGLVHRLLVRPQLERIFAYRREQMALLFASS